MATLAETNLNTHLDARDAEALAEAVEKMNRHSGIKVGDYVRFADDTLRRVSHVWDWGQGPESIQTSGGGSYHLSSSGYVSMSGGLHPGIKPETLAPTDTYRPGRVWIWHHGRPAAHNGVDCLVPFRVWTCNQPAN